MILPDSNPGTAADKFNQRLAVLFWLIFTS
jgi:hypothetical protein